MVEKAVATQQECMSKGTVERIVDTIVPQNLQEIGEFVQTESVQCRTVELITDVPALPTREKVVEVTTRTSERATEPREIEEVVQTVSLGKSWNRRWHSLCRTTGLSHCWCQKIVVGVLWWAFQRGATPRRQKVPEVRGGMRIGRKN